MKKTLLLLATAMATAMALCPALAYAEEGGGGNGADAALQAAVPDSSAKVGSALATQADGDNASYQLKYDFDADAHTASVTGYEGTPEGSAVLEIPATTTYMGEEYTVTKIADNAFKASGGGDVFGGLKLPDTLTEIGDHAFDGCARLRGTLDVPCNVGECAFQNCTGLIGVTIALGVQQIGGGAFFGCTSLTGELAIPATVSSLDRYAFAYCSGLTGLTFADGSALASIGEYAFTGCSGLTGELAIPDTITSIGDNAFASCSGLTGTLTLPSSLATIGQAAFSSCSGFTGVLSIPATVTRFGDNAFRSCTGFTTLELPDDLTCLGSRAFYGCTGLTGDVAIPAHVANLPISVFYGCTGLTGTITIPEGIEQGSRDYFLENSYFSTIANKSGCTFNADNITTLPWYYVLENAGSDPASRVSIIEPGKTYVRVELPSISGADVRFKANTSEFEYAGSAVEPEVVVTLDGQELVKDTHYSVSYSSAVNAGTVGTVYITGLFDGGYQGTVTANYTIKPKAVMPKVTLAATSYAYNGKVRTPGVTVKAGSATLKKGTDYAVTYAKGRKGVGGYKVSVKLKGNYSGSASKTFKIVPKGTRISRVTAASKGFTVKWAKQSAKMASSRITGYQVQYGMKSNFSGAKKVKVAGYSKVSKKVTGLKAKKKYYVRVRTYKKVGSTVYYSAWSAKKVVTAKS